MLVLIPVTLGPTDPDRVLPPFNTSAFIHIRHFIVEDVRSARRFLRSCIADFPIDECQFFVLNGHTSPAEHASFIEPCLRGIDVGVISEAGCPAIADPGADVVALAQAKGIRVLPLVGPSSIILSLMASGFNGQQFAFLGYLPIEGAERQRAVREMENRIYGEHQTQIFIETPYRNDKLVDELLRLCRPSTKLCIACNLTCPDEEVTTLFISEWKRAPHPNLQKRPTIFLLYQ